MCTITFQTFRLDLEKAEEPDGQSANILWIIDKARELQRNIYFCFIDYSKVFDCVDHNKLWRILKDMGIPSSLPNSVNYQCVPDGGEHLGN